MDRKFLVESNLMEAHNQFMRLCNEGYFSTVMDEAGPEEDNPQGPDAGAPDPNAAPGGEPDGGIPPMDGGTPQGPDGGAGQPPMGQDPNIPQGPDAGAPDPNATPDGEMSPMDGPEPPAPDAEPKENDDVIDVDDITKAQEKLNKKENMVGKDLGQLDNRIESLLTAVESMKGIIDHNNSEITALKAELAKRVPTQTERLGMRSLDTYPFNVNPTDYWKDKEKEGVYQAQYDNGQNPEDKKELSITANDVNDYSDTDIEQSLDDELHQSMKDIFKGF